MKRLYGILFICLLCNFQSHAQYGTLLNDTLNQTLSDKFNQYNLQGITAAVAFPDGSVWTNTEGKYGAKDLHPDVLFEAGSITKSTIAASILLLEEAGKLSIDDSLYHFISPLNNISYGITLKQLLNHTSGLYNYTEHDDFLLLINDLSQWYTKIEIDTVLARYVDAPLNQPGTNWRYCNTGFLLLGKVIESVENKPLHLVLDSLLFTPLSLDDIYMAAYDSYSNDHSGYWLDAGIHEPDPSVSFMSSAWAAGGLFTTSADLARWGYALFAGEVLSDSSFEKLTDYVDDGGDGYGLAVYPRFYRQREYLGHTGGTLMQAKLSHSVEYDFSVVVIGSDYGSYLPTRFIENALIDVVTNHMDNYLNMESIQTAEQVRIYPIPSDNRITLENLKGIKQLNVLDLKGITQFSAQVTYPQEILYKSDFGEGIFIVQLIHENGEVSHRKIIFD